MPSGKLVIIGLGNIGLQLVKMLPRDLDLVCIDQDQEVLEQVGNLRGQNTELVNGDATSRLVLEDAGIGEAEAVVLTTTTERVNVEVAKLLKEYFQVPRVLSIGITQAGIETLTALKVEVEDIFSVGATGLHNRLRQKAKSAQGIGLGKGELLEVEVHPNSRMLNKPLDSSDPRRWRVGIIYRDGQIVVPTGDSVFKPKDKVIILGEPTALKTVSEMLTFRFDQFPLEYGDTLVAYVRPKDGDHYLEEVKYLCSVFPVKKLMFLIPSNAAGLRERLAKVGESCANQEMKIEEVSALRSFAEITDVVREARHDAALLVFPKALTSHPTLSIFGMRLAKRFIADLASDVGCPIVLAGGSFPYQRVALPCLEETGLQHVVESILEISATLNFSIDALFVELSPYIASSAERRGQEDMLKIVSHHGMIYRRSIKSIHLQGNPIRAVSSVAEDYDLLVQTVSSWTNSGPLASLFKPDVAWEIARRTEMSTLLIPPVDVLI